MTKWLYNEVKESAIDFKDNMSDAIEYFYYGYIRKDGFSKSEFKYHIGRAWFDLTSPFRQIGTGFRNIRKWWMTIWEDRDFDYGYMETIISHKLKMMEDFFYSDKTNIEDAEKVGAEIKECREILDSLINETYSDEISRNCALRYL